MNTESTDERARLRALADYQVLDTPPEEVFDNISRIAARVFAVPIVLVSLVDEHRWWLKSRVGFPVPASPRELAFCDQVVRTRKTLLVPDTRADERFASNPLVAGDHGFRFYCGVPLLTTDGYVLGTLCLLDRCPRVLADEDVKTLQLLAHQVELELDIRRRLISLHEALTAQEASVGATQTFAAMIVHDLRGPLTSLSAIASSMEPHDEESREAIRDLITETERMRRLLSDVLDLCLGTLGELRLRRVDVPAQAFFRGVIARAARIAEQRHQSIDMTMPEASLSLYVDPGVFERVLDNLIGNAVSHGRDGATVAVSVSKLPDGTIRCEVRDRNEEIPAEARESIFRPFERGPASDGYGLGLAFCRVAAEAHGGRIGVTSNEGGGNCFYVELPPAGASTESLR